MPTPLRGRDAELASLREQLDRLQSGVGTCWLVEGGPGLGKSRLLAEAASAARRGGVPVGYAAAQPGEAAVEMAVLLEALFGGAGPVLDRAALGDGHASPEQRYWLLQDVQTLLERAALRQPILLCLDDLQWADGGTVAALRALPARLASLPVGWVLAYRPGETRDDLARALEELRRGGADRVVLRPLDARGVAEVAADVLGAAPDAPLLALAGRVRGNPFLLTELLAGLQEDHLVDVRSGRATLVEPRLPRRMRETMRSRLGRLSPTARRIAAVAASMGRAFTVAGLSGVLHAPASTLLDPVDQLIRAELFVERDDALAFTHDLIREAVRASQPASAVQALDRQVAAALLAAGALPVEVATQLASGAAPGDELAVQTLAKAAEALGPTDPGQAADLARRALELAGDRHPLRGPLVARTAVLLHAAARAEEARAFAAAELRHALPAEQEAEVRLGIGSMFSLAPDLRADSCRRALALPGLPGELTARLLAQLFHNLVVADRPEEARAILGKVRDAVDATGDGAARFTMELAESGLEYIEGHLDAALGLVDAALRTGRATGDDARTRLAVHLRCGVLAATDRFDEALAAAGDGVRAAQRDRQGWALHMFETWRGRQFVQLGRLADAAAMLEGRYSPADAHLVVGVLDAASVVALGRAAIHRGDRRQTELTGAIARAMLETGAPGVRRHAAWLLALQAAADGDADGARRWLGAVVDDQRPAVFPLFPIDPGDDPQLVRVAIACGDLGLAEAVAAGAERRRDLNPAAPAMAACAAHARALLTGDRGRMADAVAGLETSGRTLALASALEDLAVLDARAGDAQRAVGALDRALALYAACEATRDAARVRRRLRSLGVRRRLVGARRPVSGYAALTDSELAVVRLVADGLTNREVAERLYVSPHTVNGHLRHAFGKLGVNSRVGLTRVVAEHGHEVDDTAAAAAALPRRTGR